MIITEGRIAKMQHNLQALKHRFRDNDSAAAAVLQEAWDLIDELFDELEIREPLIKGIERRPIKGRWHERWTAKGPWVDTGEGDV